MALPLLPAFTGLPSPATPPDSRQLLLTSRDDKSTGNHHNNNNNNNNNNSASYAYSQSQAQSQSPSFTSSPRRKLDPRLPRTRRPSLRKAKNSTEDLRARTGTGTGTRPGRSGSTTSYGTATLSEHGPGRSFTVSNFNNGIIYLRPSVRPGSQRNHPTLGPFTFPPTPDAAPSPSPPLPVSATATSFLSPITPTSTPPLPRPPPPLVSNNVWRESFFSTTPTPTPQADCTLDEAQYSPTIATSPQRAGPPTTASAPNTPQRRKRSQHQHPAIHPTSPLPVYKPSGGHARSHSFSTVDEHHPHPHPHSSHQPVEPGTFKVVIERPAVRRPKTAETSGGPPIIHVPIPNYRLGTPRFSARGTAILRSSVLTRASGTTDQRSSSLSQLAGLDYDKLFPSPPAGLTHYSFLSRRHSEASPQLAPFLRRNPTITTIDGQMQSSSEPSSPHISAVAIGPHLFDAFTTNPDDSAYIRFGQNGAILAATPSRLIAHITSPSFLDYELLSDFFLTFRSFIDPSDLVAYLVARLRWAVSRADDFGRIVRVRTFVALRHWILNYFVEDFSPKFQLRLLFCTLVNVLYDDLRMRKDRGGGDIKIIGELKKCWRRTVGQYWQSPATMGSESPDDSIHPGGSPSARNTTTTMTVTASNPSGNNGPTHVRVPSTSTKNQATSCGQLAVNRPKTAPMASATGFLVQQKMRAPSRPPHATNGDYFHFRHQASLASTALSSAQLPSLLVQPSPASEQSLQVLSCSIPLKIHPHKDAGAEAPLFPRPVPATSVAARQHGQHHLSPKMTGEPNRPVHAHKRSGSFSDALRDRRAPLPQPKTSSSTSSDQDTSSLLFAEMIPGSLIRGAAYQPDSPLIEVRSIRDPKSMANLRIDTDDANGLYASAKPTVAHGPNVKKLFGSVRRALSSRHPHYPGRPQTPQESQLQSSSTSSASSSPRKRLAASSAGVASKGGATNGISYRRAVRARQPVRIDLLAAKVAETFRQAVAAELEQRSSRSLSGNDVAAVALRFSQEPERSPLLDAGALPLQVPRRDRIASGHVTLGSQSIIIFDDTGAQQRSASMSGALPTPSLYAASGSIAVSSQALPESPDDRILPSTAVEALTTIEPKSEVMLLDGDLDIVTSQTISHGEHKSAQPTSETDSTRSLPPKISPLPRHPLPTFRRQPSTRSNRSRRSSLRRYASHHSGLTQGSRPHRPSAPTTAAPSEYDAELSSSDDDDPFALDRTPLRKLRRRPGGDLRAVDNVHDLEQFQRPMSTGSLSNQSHRLAGSMAFSIGETLETTTSLVTKSRVNEEAAAPERVVKSLSLIDTHSSQPNLRPSFEAEVLKLAALPDDENDDGGIESALMKLEGRFEKQSPERPISVATSNDLCGPLGNPRLGSDGTYSFLATSAEDSSQDGHNRGQVVQYNHPEETTSHGSWQHRVQVREINDSTADVSRASLSQDPSNSSLAIDATSFPIPTGLEGPGSANQLAEQYQPAAELSRVDSTSDSPPIKVPMPLSVSSSKFGMHIGFASDSNSSIEYVEETDSLRRIPRGSTIPLSVKHASFLLDENQNLSDVDLSHISHLVAQSDVDQGDRSFFDDDDDASVKLESVNDLFRHPLRHPPTPPLSADRPSLKGAFAGPSPPISGNVLPTPGTTPTFMMPSSIFGGNPAASAPDLKGIELKDLTSLHIQEPLPTFNQKPPAHFPFILAYDSETLAQQFTIIEKDALDETDWRELIELRWKQSSHSITDWVTYLRTQEPQGVDIAIARFNIMVKWAMSECVLTESLEERVRCVVKYIHIAAHARRMRNYATMYQLTIALLSADCTRLMRTWELVPESEKQTLRDLEALVQPIRNFHNLRMEMETASLEHGIIPFIGVYTRDLIYNAQKPPIIAVGEPAEADQQQQQKQTNAMTNPATEPLVNFERYHTAATVVKSLLRLLEASSKYTFTPVPEILSKCLWMASLTDEEITAQSKKRE